MPSSKLKEAICKVLVSEGFLLKYEILTKGGKNILRVFLKYSPNKYGRLDKPLIEDIKQISRPGRRVYIGAEKMPRVQSGFGISIISSPLGVMTGEAARKKNVGGEVLIYVY